MNRHLGLLLCLFLWTFLPATALFAGASVNTVCGSLSLDGEWDSNIYLEDKGEDSAWLYGVTGILIYSNEEQFGRSDLNYSLRVRQNTETNDAEVEHMISLYLTRELRKEFSIELSDLFDTGFDTLSQIARDQRLYKRKKRRRYYTNTARLSANYSYGDRRDVTMGYNNQYYDSNGNYTNEYMRHEFFATWEHKFGTHYGLAASAEYEKGDFKDSADTEGEAFDIGIINYLTPHDTVSLTYAYSNFTYREDRSDYTTQTLSFGWTREITERDVIHTDIGVSYWENDADDSDWTPRYETDYTRRFRRGSVTLNGSGGFGNMSYSGDNAGLSKYWMVEISFNYELIERLQLIGSLNFRHDDFIQSVNDHQEDRYLTKVGLDYTIWKRLSTGISYEYNIIDSTLPDDDFTDHRIFVFITAMKDLYRW